MSLFTAQTLSHQKGHEISLHSHLQGQLTLVLGGTANIHNDQGWWLATAGSAVWVPPGVRHCASYQEQAEIINLLLDVEAGDKAPGDCCLVMVSALLRELAREASRLEKNDDAQGPIRALVLRQLQGHAVQTELYVPQGEDKRLRAVTGWLRSHPGSTDELAALAERAFTSPRTLARLFEKETGMSFSRWRERLRIVVAIDRLVSGQSIITIALDLGYQSASAFTAVFTRVMGMPPRKYLARLQQPDL
ncbi:MAG: helix-turn-helix transcriptional regulator [Pseudomonadota bacterium]|uniref:AraC family transcriptional regulator n=1 Tax=Gallaecimonas pentaromativorans TaxID=584787 RepID=UPI00067EA8F1|nr:helix-turn-helix transcriptional regulator [Gallaecimonas pentaromativorans]MED5525675.1 helix-turn-helix transcriptional regulator [Pseudomonadota bacterium]